MRKHTKQAIQAVGSLFLIVIIAVATYTSFLISQADIEVVDPTLIVGGSEEYGYLSANYLIARTPSGELQHCGQVVLPDKISITAAHCLVNAETSYLSKGEYKLNLGSMLLATRSLTPSEWGKTMEQSSDIAAMTHSSDDAFYRTTAQIAKPIEGCYYELVGYGKATATSPRVTRRSMGICVGTITSNTFAVYAESSSDCFGDKAGIVYYKNTDKVVGIVTSTVADSDSESSCPLDQQGLAVRIDSYQSLVQAVAIANPTAVDIHIYNQAHSNPLAPLSYAILEYGEGIQAVFARITIVLIGILLGVIFLLVIKPKIWGNAEEPRHHT